MRRLISTPLSLFASVVVIVLLFFYPTHPRFLLTTSQSMPRGLYRIDYTTRPKRGSIVTFRLPESIEHTMETRSWFQPGVRYLKKVGALPGDQVCVTGATLTVNETLSLPLFSKDQDGTPLPQLPPGCTFLQSGEFLPLSDHFPRSFDGRYYGALKLDLIEGVATLVFRL